MGIPSSSKELLRLVVGPVVDRLLGTAAFGRLDGAPRRGGRARPRIGTVAEPLERRELLSTTYLSDLPWVTATNGWGPVERDMSNGGQAAGDGNTITLNGVTYAKGLGTNADASIVYNLNGQYTSFISDVGVDDEEGSRGSVVFQVYADGTKVYDSGLMTGDSATETADVSVVGVQQLTLVTNDGGDGADYDHGDWAGARLIGPPAVPAGLTAVATSATQVSLTWTEASPDVTGYVVQRSQDGTNFSTIATLNTSVPGYADSGLATNTSYIYRVVATSADGSSAASAVAGVNTLAAPGSATYVSDLSWVSATNGWGPVERDQSVGGQAADDGTPITLNGVTYAKGLGTNADSTVIYNLGGQYARFLSDVGVDDHEQYDGSVVFQVYADGTKVYDSGVMVPSSPTQAINVSVVGVQQLELVVGDAGDGTDFDQGDWAGARLLTVPSAAPANLNGAARSTTEADLSWDPVAGATGYDVYRGTVAGGESAVPLNASPLTATGYADSGLSPGTTYYYVVRAVDAGGTGPASSEVPVTPPASVGSTGSGSAADTLVNGVLTPGSAGWTYVTDGVSSAATAGGNLVLDEGTHLDSELEKTLTLPAGQVTNTVELKYQSLALTPPRRRPRPTRSRSRWSTRRPGSRWSPRSPSRATRP